MSLIQKISPVGIDKTIDFIQSSLYSYLTGTSNWGNYESYPRAYKNPSEGNTIPEISIDPLEYKETLMDDDFSASSFFLVDDNASSDDNGVFTQSISIIYQGILTELYPAIPHRADAEMLDDIMKGFNSITGYDVTNIITGVNNVYSDLSITGRLSELVNMDDMSQFHVVRVDFEVQYEYNCKYDEL